MQKVILETVVGSTVHGIAVQDGLEDLDLMAVILEDPTEIIGWRPQDVWVTRTKPEGVRSEAGDIDYVAYGLRKFLGLALKGNPSILLAFFTPTPFVRIVAEEGRALQALAPAIVSKQMYKPYRGYVRQQHERLLGLRGQRRVTRPELVAAYGYDTKYAAHIVRLGYQGEELLLTGHLTLPMTAEHVTLLKKIRLGGFSLIEISAMILAAEQRLEEAYTTSPLPAMPRTAFVERWMLKTYLTYWHASTMIKEKENPCET